MDLLGASRFPFLSRRSYVYEMLHIAPWSLLAGLIESQFAGIVVSKTFHGSDQLIAIATATPVGAQLFSLVWGMLCIGRSKRILFTIFASATALVAGLLGAIPATPSGGVWFVVQIAAAQVLLAGVVTVRSAVWKLNYPRSHRGQITARIQRVRSIGSIVALLASGVALDQSAESYRFIFPIAALGGLVGTWISTRIRVRGDRHHRPLRAESDLSDRAKWIEPFSLTALLSPGHVLSQMVGVLRRDRRFLLYCVAQSMTGISNLLTMSVGVAVVTRSLDPGDEWGFWISTSLVSALPNLAMMGSINRWGGLFDKLGVLRFRVINVLCWGAGLLFGLCGTFAVEYAMLFGSIAFPLALLMFAFRGLANGLGQGGGALAWNLGHLDFAKPDEAELYMGIHVSLTGLRGLIAPLVGIWLWRHIGWAIWLVGFAFSLMSLWLYHRMACEEQRQSVTPSTAPIAS